MGGKITYRTTVEGMKHAGIINTTLFPTFRIFQITCSLDLLEEIRVCELECLPALQCCVKHHSTLSRRVVLE